MFLEAFGGLKARITWVPQKRAPKGDLRMTVLGTFLCTVLDSRDLSRLAHKLSKTGPGIKPDILARTCYLPPAGRGDIVRYLITSYPGFRCQRLFGGSDPLAVLLDEMAKRHGDSMQARSRFSAFGVAEKHPENT